MDDCYTNKPLPTTLAGNTLRLKGSLRSSTLLRTLPDQERGHLLTAEWDWRRAQCEPVSVELEEASLIRTLPVWK